MPYKIEKNAAGQFCVVKESDGSVIHCHATEAKARAQMRALYANEKKSAEQLIYFGEAIKALDEQGRVGGYLVKFTDSSRKDLDGEWFTAKTYYGAHGGDGVDTVFHHGRSLPLKTTQITPAMKAQLDVLKDHFFHPVKVTADAIGLFAETVLDMADEYEKMVYDLVTQGKLGWSSGAVNHLAKVAPSGEILRWVIGEASLTPRPSEPMNRAIALKSLDDDEAIKAVWTTAYQNDLPDSSFAYVEPGGKKDSDGKTVPRSLRHFPYKDKDGKPDAAHVRNALARIPQSKVSEQAKASALKKIQAAAKKLGIEVADEKKSLDTIIERVQAKGMLADELAEHDDSYYEVYCAFMDLIRDIAEAGCVDGLAGVSVDVDGSVDSCVDEFAEMVKPIITTQIHAYIDSDSDMNSYFYLKGLGTSLSFEEAGTALTKFVDAMERNHFARVKVGRMLSAANRKKLQAFHDQMGSLMGDVKDLLAMSEPKPKAADPTKLRALRLQQLRLRAA